MFEYLQQLLGERGMAPHGYCLLWDPALIWTHVISDALIGLSYFSIPIVIARFLTRRRDVQFSWIVWMFAAFIMACGTTHFMSILVLWVPAYGIEGLLKLVTAIVSVVTAVALWPLLPKAIAVPSPAQLQRANAELETRIAERDAALAALGVERQERERTAEMLRQAQKMEAVGHLTGGIAHDFNNLLTIIVGNLDRASRLADGDERIAKSLKNALTGAEKAATLTDRLLAFSRKQPLQPKKHDLNLIVTELRDLLERSLGGGINLKLSLSVQPVIVETDRNQTENAILNLAINARDAMPEGGVLTILTENLGETAILSVQDDGMGMAANVVEHVFEPFFTTKPVGQGTGLGLSQVYGFAKQSGGDVTINSSIGAGTMVSLSFPKSDLAAV